MDDVTSRPAERGDSFDNAQDKLKSLRLPRNETAERTWSLPKFPNWLWGLSGIALGAATVVAATRLSPHQTASPRMENSAATSAVSITADTDAAGTLVASGYVVAAQRATVASEVTGRIVSLPVKEGAIVRRGQVLATLNSVPAQASLDRLAADARATNASVALYQEQADQTGRELARYDRLADKGYASSAALEAKRSAWAQALAQLNAAKATASASDAAVRQGQSQLRQYAVVAPFGGQVSSLNAQVGEIISPMSAGGFTRTGICTIVNLDTLGVEVDVGEAVIGKVHQGQAAAVELDAYPGTTFDARVDTIFPTANMEKSTIRVRISFLHKDPRVLPEMAAKVTFLR